MPLPDVVALIGRSTGKFEIWRYERQHHYELRLRSNTISSLSFNGQDIVSPVQAKSFISELIKANDGEFEFTRGPESSGPHTLRLDELLLSSLTMADEILTLQQHFPEPDTVFLATGKEQTWLDQDLQQFWKEASPFLEKGASSQDLYLQMGLYLDQIRLKLYKLRAMRLIEPQRVLTAVQAAVPVELPREEESRESLGSIQVSVEGGMEEDEAVLRPIWDTEETSTPLNGLLEASTQSPEPVAFKPFTPRGLRPVSLYQPSKSVLGSLMKSIQGLVGERL